MLKTIAYDELCPLHEKNVKVVCVVLIHCSTENNAFHHFQYPSFILHILIHYQLFLIQVTPDYLIYQTHSVCESINEIVSDIKYH